MSNLVDDLLSLSRVEQVQRKRPKARINLSEVVARALSELDPVINPTGSKVNFDDHQSGAMVKADEDQLRQVISNLVQNALRYGDSGAPVHVKLEGPSYDQRLRSRVVHLSIEDSGKGIAEHHIPRLTERFYRVDSHRSREVGGTGLGLAIVKHILQRHRGRLKIESELGKGSKFTVILPVSE